MHPWMTISLTSSSSMNNCGTCKNYLELPLVGPTCRKTQKSISYLMVKDCWEDKTAPDIVTKVCNRCHRTLPITEFCRKSTEKDGYQRQCKECQKELAKVYYQREKEKKEAEASAKVRTDPNTGYRYLTKRCAKCGQILPVESFGRNTRSSDGLKSYCRDCENENTRAWKAKRDEGRRKSLTVVPLDELIDELRRRGWKGILTQNQITV